MQHTSKEINFFVFFSLGKETYQSKVSVEMRRLSWATPPFHTVFPVHLNNFAKCSVFCFVFSRPPKNANPSTVKNIATLLYIYIYTDVHGRLKCLLEDILKITPLKLLSNIFFSILTYKSTCRFVGKDGNLLTDLQ